MPITNFQSDVLRLLAAQRSHDSDIAGGVVSTADWHGKVVRDGGQGRR